MKFNFILLVLIFTSCAKHIQVSVIHPKRGTTEQTVTTINSGTVEAKHQAELAFGTVGRISKIHSSVGKIVSAGALIAELENGDLKAVYDETQKELVRAAELYKNGLVSISNLESAKRANEVAHSALEKTLMKAPFKGMITSLNLKIAELYQSNTTLDKKSLVQIIDLEKRIVKGEIDEIDLQKIANGNTARIKIPAMNNQILNAIVTKVVPFVSTAKDQDRTSQIELEFLDNKTLVPVGASADVEIVTKTKENVLTLPTNYILGTGKNRFVYLEKDGKLTKKSITLGVGNYDKIEILNDLTENDSVVAPPEGVELIDGMKVKAELKTWP
jgi:RND family efflux transporter MFP subunit